MVTALEFLMSRKKGFNNCFGLECLAINAALMNINVSVICDLIQNVKRNAIVRR